MPGVTHSDQTWTLKPTSQGLCYDEKKVGKKALRAEDIRKMPTALIREQNAVPFDPNAGWTTGDLIPEYVLIEQILRDMPHVNVAKSETVVN